uniref:DNA replication and repair protein RecF n=1 Tax=uncultured Thiotrichaceae bacterium TaxID=298394 RepID=A0A6S6U8V8_9GAMM|nr:MAG: DNA recombination and repair protein RecF [uncultured Thiotrichaceae bacterium]
MWLKQLSIENCRLIDKWDIELSESINWIIGANAEGKSSLLEALSILARGRSFRTPRIREVIRQGTEQLVVSGRIHDETLQSDYPIGISKTLSNTRIRINHADIHQQAELSSHLPLTIIHPDTISLLTGSPGQRRALLDWVAFYRNKDFHQDWKNYQRILKQRNSCLRDPQQRYAVQHWTDQLVKLQPRIHYFRLDALQAIEKVLGSIDSLFDQQGALTLKLYTGFPANVDLTDEDKLKHFFTSKLEQETDQGVTLYGCHRGDLNVLLDDLPVAQFASRGQLKMFGIALLLAQSQAITTKDTKRGIIAIDDLASELDNDNQALLYQVLKQTRQQLIVTGTQPPDSGFADVLHESGKMFHVEHGQINAVET